MTTRPTQNLVPLAALLTLLAGSRLASAQFTFTGGGTPSTNWCTDANWQPMMVPPSGSTIAVGPGEPIDMFLCDDPTYAVGNIITERRVRFWPAMSFLNGGTLTDADLAMNINFPSSINGNLTLIGTGSTFTSGLISGGSVINTGTLRSVQLSFPGHSRRVIGPNASFINQGRFEHEATISLNGLATLENLGTMVFQTGPFGTPQIRYDGSSIGGALFNRDTIEVGPGSTGIISTDYVGTGTVRATSGTIEFFGGVRRFEREALVTATNGTILINAFGTLDEATFDDCIASGSGQLKLEGGNNYLLGLFAEFNPDTGNGLWFSNGNSISSTYLNSVVVSGLCSWSQGTLQNNSGELPTLAGPRNLIIASNGIWRIGTPVETNGPGFLDRISVSVEGAANQQADVRLRNNAIVVVEPNANWTLTAGRAIRGEAPVTDFIVRGDLIVTAGTQPASSIAQAVVTIEGDGRLLLSNTRLEVNNLITTANPFEMADNAVLDISTLGEFRLQNTLVVTRGSPRWVGSAKLTTVGPTSPGTTIIRIDDGGTLTNELEGSSVDDGFFLSHELRSGIENFELEGFTATFFNHGDMYWRAGEIAISSDLPEGFSNFDDLFIQNAGNHRVTQCTMANFANTFHQAGQLELNHFGYFRNDAAYIFSQGSIVRGPATLQNAFINSPFGTLSKVTPATTATISTTLNNQGTVAVVEGTLDVTDIITQMSGTPSNASLNAGTWRVSPLATLNTTDYIIRTLNSGASVTLDGNWPQFQPDINRGTLRLSGPRTFPRGITNRDDGSIAIDGPTTFGGPLIIEDGTVSINAPVRATSYSQSGGIVVQSDVLTLDTTFNISGGFFVGRAPVEFEGDLGIVDASGAFIRGDAQFGSPTSPPVQFNCSPCTLEPGNSPGVITVFGSLVMQSGAALEIELAGRDGPGAPTGHDQLAATVSAALAGTLRVTLLDGFVPVAGDSFLVVASPSLTGQFENVSTPPDLAADLRVRLITSEAGLELRFVLPTDFNADGVTDPDDLSDYITCFFSTPPCPPADFNADGAIDPDDLSDYITAFFAL